MVFGSVSVRALRLGVLAVGVAVLAGCSTVTYGTGTPTTAQTLQDVAGIVDFTRDRDVIVYEERPGLQTPPDATLPPPQEAAETPPPQQPVLTQEQRERCAIAPGQVAPPPDYCTPNPNAPAVTQETGLFGNANDGGIRSPINPCSWFQLTWGQLTPEEQGQWERLGWTPATFGAANAAAWPPAAYLPWRDLSFGERRAAGRLGFDESTWGACPV